jgi:IS4 transposase
MATDKITSVETFLKNLVPMNEIRAQARGLGAVQRVRAVDVAQLLIVVVVFVCGRGEQSLAAMRRALSMKAGVSLARSSFWDRFTPGFEALVDWLLERLRLASVESPPVYTGLLQGFKDVQAVDSTVVQVHKSLSSLWKGTRKSTAEAALKVHTFVRAVTGELLRYRITAEAHADCKAFAIGHWAKDMLFLFDRGYSSASLWWRVHRVGGYFVTRLTSTYTPEIRSVNRLHRGRARNLAGRPLWEALDGLARAELDVNCRFRVHIRAYGKQRGRWLDHDFRVVGLWDATRKAYSLYVTNVSPERFSPADVAQAYRLRWEVETYYKTGKSGFGLDELPSRKPHIVRTLVKAALVRASIAMQAKRRAEPNLPAKQWINPMQWVQVWRVAVEAVLGAVLTGVRLAPSLQPTWESLATLARDPNVNRPPTRWTSLQELRA